MTSSVSIITVSYHTGPTLWITIEAALRQTECLEIIIVNNGNTPADEKRLRDWAEKEPRIHLLSGHGNIGFGRGNNLGVAQARGDYVLLLNPDSMLPDGALVALLSEISRFPENTLAGCYLMNPDGSEQRGGRRAILTPANAVAESFGLNFLLSAPDKLNYNKMPMPDTTHEVPVISGAFMFLVRSFYQRLGGFDEGYFLHMEDTDFCYRVHQAGGKVICIPSVKVLHFRSTSEVTSAFIEKHKAKGFVRYMNKFFASQHSKSFMRLLIWGIYGRLWLKIGISKIDNILVSPVAAKQEVAALALLYQLTRFDAQNSSLAGKTLLVAGATSQLGLCIAGRALAKGAKVIALYHNFHPRFSHPNLEWRKCNLEKAKKVDLLEDVQADIFIHAAPLALFDKLYDVLHETIKRVVILGSGVPSDKPTARVEKRIIGLCASQQRKVTILNPLLPYGVGLDDSLVPMAHVMKRFGFITVYGGGQGRRNPAQAMDVTDAVFAIMDNAKTFGKIYSLGGASVLTYRETIARVAAYIGISPRVVQVPFMPFILGLLGRVYQIEDMNEKIARRMNSDITFDNTQAIGDFNYSPKAFLDGNITL